MVQVVLVSHGPLAEALVSSAKMILRCDMEGVHAVCLTDDGIETFEKRIKAIAEQIQKEEIILLADIKGGSPFNASLSVFRNCKFKVVTGMNLSVVIEALMNRECLSLNEIADTAMKNGKESIEKISLDSLLGK
ncbi:PTS sugar transporter subunit IIA [Propionispora vibrioides]|uniref:PTS system, mannose-specific IIA component n=1 Tax=Propionispora vibrioides TaxID=112903 RepID=A0A1H8T7Q9_9FIRM|nr:PTS sugar transporter subunit IIA [Propionispora vibrioides]SEO86503.1 PTS system, mannose-specific IIA component [Propionispora vibrioides]